MNLFSFFVLILGVLSILFPNQVIMFGRGWMFNDKSASPSKAVTYTGRIIGVILIVLVLLGKFK